MRRIDRVGLWLCALLLTPGASVASAEIPGPQCMSPVLVPGSEAIPSNSPGFLFLPGARLGDQGEVALDREGLRVTRAGASALAFEAVDARPGEYRFALPLREGDVIRFEAPDGCSVDGSSWTRELRVGPSAPMPASISPPRLQDVEEGHVISEVVEGCMVTSPMQGAAIPFTAAMEGMDPAWFPFLQFTTEVDGRVLRGHPPAAEGWPGDVFGDQVELNCESPRRSAVEEGRHELTVKVEMIGSDLEFRSASSSFELRCSDALMREIHHEARIAAASRSLRSASRYLIRSGWWVAILLLFALMIAAFVGVRWHRRRPDWSKSKDGD